MTDSAAGQERFADWCTAFGIPVPDATSREVLAWLEAEQPDGRTAARWTLSVTETFRAAGHPDPCAGRPRMWVRRARNPASRSALPEPRTAALAARIPSGGWTAGLFGRRNRLAFLLHQVAGISGPELVTLRAGHLEVTGHATVTLLAGRETVTVATPDLPAAACIACAAVRWGSMLRHADDFNRPAIQRLLNREQPALDAHVCAPLEAAGPKGWPLFPAADPRGYFALPPVPPMTYQAMKTLLKHSAAGTGAYRVIGARRPQGQRDRPEPEPEPRSSPVDSGWHARGIAARARDRDTLSGVDAALRGFEAEAARAAALAEQFLGRLTDEDE
jgi:hypothetical protein